MNEEAERNDKHPKKAVKHKFFEGRLPNDCKIKKTVLPFTEVKTNIQKWKSLDKIEISDDEENKENIPMNVPIGTVQNEDSWTRTHEEIMMQSSFSEAVQYLKCTPFPELVTNFHTVMRASDRVDKISLHLYPPNGPDRLMPRYVTGNGNCLPQTLSLITFGTEHHHLKIDSELQRKEFSSLINI